MKKLAVFLASTDSANPLFLNAIDELALLLAQEKTTLVYGGSTTGLMGKLANATLAAGGKVIGVFPQTIQSNESPHAELTQLIQVNSLAKRIEIMQQLADAFMVFPGGLGTLEELFIVWNQRRLGLLNKPIGILATDDYYQPLHRFLVDNMRHENFITDTALKIPFMAKDVKLLYTMLK
jgi:uncharacterized protein (TIGR00730 family)